jgi:hypothetical protein
MYIPLAILLERFQKEMRHSITGLLPQARLMWLYKAQIRKAIIIRSTDGMITKSVLMRLISGPMQVTMYIRATDGKMISRQSMKHCRSPEKMDQ